MEVETMDERMIPYFSHEGDMARKERANKRLWIVILVLIVALIGSNAGWLYFESQFVEEETTVEQDVETGQGDATVTGVGDINYGTSEAESNN
jgi:hypothetical protein